MIDIHTHILFDVDDGSDSLETSIKMIQKEISDGVTDIILTPHYNKRSKSFNKERIISNYHQLLKEVKDRNLNINLYLGYEIYYREGMLKEIEGFTIANSKYLLIEFSTNIQTDIEELVYDLVSNGYKPIIAHCERYTYLSIDDYIKIKEAGALLQVNAATVIGKHGLKLKRRFKKLLSLGLVDFIASDMHNLSDRNSYMKDAFYYINKKLDREYIDLLLNINQKKILNKIIQ